MIISFLYIKSKWYEIKFSRNKIEKSTWKVKEILIYLKYKKEKNEGEETEMLENIETVRERERES